MLKSYLKFGDEELLMCLYVGEQEQRMLFFDRNIIIFLEHNNIIIIIPEHMFVNLNVVLHRH